MPQREDRLERYLAFLYFSDWVDIYWTIEAEAIRWFKNASDVILRTERAARGALLLQLEEFGEVSGGQLNRIQGRLSGVYAGYLEPQGSLGRYAHRGVESAARAGREAVELQSVRLARLAAYAGDEGGMKKALGLAGLESADIVEPRSPRVDGRRLGLSKWALDRDLELLSDRSAHRVALGVSAADGGPASTAMSKLSLRNSLLGTYRHSVRSQVSANTKRWPGGWMRIRPFKGGRSSQHAKSESAWSKEINGGSWKVRNPVSSWGMHVGSRSYFGAAWNFGAVAAALSLLIPETVDELIRSAPSRRESQTLSSRPSKGSMTIDGILLTIEKALEKLTHPVTRPTRTESGLQAEVSLVTMIQEPALIVLRRGHKRGIQLGDVLEVSSRDGAYRGRVQVTAVYPETSTAVVLAETFVSVPRVLDVATLVSQ